MRRIYLDYNATTPLDPRCREGMEPYLERVFGNPSSTHAPGREARAALDRAREQVAGALGASSPGEVVFTASGSESCSLAVMGAVRAWRRRQGGDRRPHVITSCIEHPCVLEACSLLAREGVSVTHVPVDAGGRLDPRQVLDAVTDETVVASVAAVNHETGVIQPLEGLGEALAERGVLLHVDAVQALGRIPVAPFTAEAHLLSAAAHKIYGPKGVGALYVAQGTETVPLVAGGNQEGGRRGGTENVAGIVGFGRAAELASTELAKRREHLLRRQKQVEEAVLAGFPGAHVNGAASPRAPGTCSVTLPAPYEGEALAIALDLAGVAVSTGSACASGAAQASPVLLAMGGDEDRARRSVRFSVGMPTTEEEVDSLRKILTEIRGRWMIGNCSG